MPKFDEFELWVNGWIFISFCIWYLIFFIIVENQITVSNLHAKIFEMFHFILSLPGENLLMESPPAGEFSVV